MFVVALSWLLFDDPDGTAVMINKPVDDENHKSKSYSEYLVAAWLLGLSSQVLL